VLQAIYSRDEPRFAANDTGGFAGASFVLVLAKRQP
jgi:hypothetical protein